MLSFFFLPPFITPFFSFIPRLGSVSDTPLLVPVFPHSFPPSMESWVRLAIFVWYVDILGESRIREGLAFRSNPAISLLRDFPPQSRVYVDLEEEKKKNTNNH